MPQAERLAGEMAAIVEGALAPGAPLEKTAELLLNVPGATRTNPLPDIAVENGLWRFAFREYAADALLALLNT